MQILTSINLFLAMAIANDLLGKATMVAMREHLYRLGIWAILSIIIGGLIMWRRWQSESWRHFGLQCAVWGLIDGIIVLFGLQDYSHPDLSATAKLREFIWLNEGLDVGYIGVGVTLMLVRWRVPSSPLYGAGIAVIIQGLALLVLDGVLLWQLPSVAQWLSK